MQARFTGDWDKAAGILLSLSASIPAAMESALQDEAHFLRKHIVKGITSQAPGGKPFKPLSPVTLAIRKLMGFRGTKALIRSGDLRASISVAQAGRGAVFVGVLYSAVGSDGRKLADVAAVHEFGATIRMSLSRARLRFLKMAMRRYRMSTNKGGEQGGMGVVRIPPRPFLQPIVDMFMGSRGAARFAARVAQKLGGTLGVISHPDLGGKSAVVVPGRLMGTRGSALMNKGVEKAIKEAGRSKVPTAIKNAMKTRPSGARPRPAKIPLAVRIQRRRAVKKQAATTRRVAKKARIMRKQEAKKTRVQNKLYKKLSKAMAPKQRVPKQQAAAHVAAMKRHFASQSKAMAPKRPPKQTSHVAAMKAAMRKQSKAMAPKIQVPKQASAHVTAMKRHFSAQSRAMAPKRQVAPRPDKFDAHVSGMKRYFRAQSKAMAPKRQKV